MNRDEEHVMMKRANLNFLIDTVAFVAFVLLISTGLLVHYVLPAGSGHFSILWGMDRHELSIYQSQFSLDGATDQNTFTGFPLL